MKKFIIIILLLAALPLAASARGHVSVGFGYGGGYYPGYAPYYPAYPAYPYYQRPVYVQPAPIIVEQVNPYGAYARPAPVYYDERPETGYDDGYCREYTRNVKINGRIQQSYGTTCRQPDGSWEIVD